MSIPTWHYHTNSTIKYGDSSEKIEEFIKKQIVLLTEGAYRLPEDFFFYRFVGGENRYRYSASMPRPTHGLILYKYYIKPNIYKVVVACKESGRQYKVIAVK